ncbi:MAG: DUF1559 domain-containing protein [Pirellulales bacterium]|nr:DUF1559 domain-containing protein [Pirellulales bacterium]
MRRRHPSCRSGGVKGKPTALHTHFAFTLVELLVVITIISILMGLLIPAVNAARETARRSQCSVNVKNLALAALQYEQTKGGLPPYIDKFGVFVGRGDPSDPANFSGSVPRHVKVGGYGVSLLPWLDAQPTYEQWTQERYPVIADGAPGSLGKSLQIGRTISGEGFHPLAAPNLEIFQCPSNPVSDVTHGRNSYISNNGMCHVRTKFTEGATGAGSVVPYILHSDAQSSANGTSVCGYVGVGNIPTTSTSRPMFAAGRKVKLDDLKDGQGFTALYSENVQAFPWHQPGFLNGAGPIPNLVASGSPNDLDYEEANPILPPRELIPMDNDGMIGGEMVWAQFTAGWVWHYEDQQSHLLPYSSPSGEPVNPLMYLHGINGRGSTASQSIFTLQMSPGNAPDLARPSSAHVDGVNVGFADGSTRFVSDSISYRVYQAIMTPRGKSSDVPWPEFVLTDHLDNQ